MISILGSNKKSEFSQTFSKEKPDVDFRYVVIEDNEPVEYVCPCETTQAPASVDMDRDDDQRGDKDLQLGALMENPTEEMIKYGELRADCITLYYAHYFFILSFISSQYGHPGIQIVPLFMYLGFIASQTSKCETSDVPFLVMLGTIFCYIVFDVKQVLIGNPYMDVLFEEIDTPYFVLCKIACVALSVRIVMRHQNSFAICAFVTFMTSLAILLNLSIPYFNYIFLCFFMIPCNALDKGLFSSAVHMVILTLWSILFWTMSFRYEYPTIDKLFSYLTTDNIKILFEPYEYEYVENP